MEHKKRIELFIDRLSQNNPSSNEKPEDIYHRFKREQQREEEIVRDEDYFNWIETFMTDHKFFFADGSYLKPNELTQEDLANIQDIKVLYRALEKYAEQNPQSAFFDGYVNGIHFKYHNQCYEIAGSSLINYYLLFEENQPEHYLVIDNILQHEKPSTRKRHRMYK